MGSRHSRSRRRGVTLLEVSLAMGLLVLLSSMTYWFYSSVLETREHGTEEARELRLARVVLHGAVGRTIQVGLGEIHIGIACRGNILQNPAKPNEEVVIHDIARPTNGADQIQRWLLAENAGQHDPAIVAHFDQALTVLISEHGVLAGKLGHNALNRALGAEGLAAFDAFKRLFFMQDRG